MTEFEQNGSYIVSWDFTNGKDIGILIVGKQHKGKVDIVNAIQGEEAYELYKKLSGIKDAK